MASSLENKSLTPSTSTKINNSSNSSLSSSKLPDDNTLQHACRLAIVEDKAIMLDYWTFSLEKNI